MYLFIFSDVLYNEKGVDSLHCVSIDFIIFSELSGHSKQDDLVFDPFVGSGATALCSAILGRGEKIMKEYTIIVG